MSWGDYITRSLVNRQDANGHVYNNVLTEAAIMGMDGAEWAKTAGLSVKPDEIKKLNELFKQSENNTPSIMLGGKKYQVTHYEKMLLSILKLRKEVPPLLRIIRLLSLVSITLPKCTLMMENHYHKVSECATLLLKISQILLKEWIIKYLLLYKVYNLN